MISCIWPLPVGQDSSCHLPTALAREDESCPTGKVESMRTRVFVRLVPEPRAGGSVFVPQKDPTDRKDYVAIVGAVAQVLASLVAIVVVLTR